MTFKRRFEPAWLEFPTGPLAGLLGLADLVARLGSLSCLVSMYICKLVDITLASPMLLHSFHVNGFGHQEVVGTNHLVL